MEIVPYDGLIIMVGWRGAGEQILISITEQNDGDVEHISFTKVYCWVTSPCLGWAQSHTYAVCHPVILAAL